MNNVQEYHCDVLVVGSGAGGFSAAITARKAGLNVLLTEKAPVFGGTTAISGGYIWIPGNPLAEAAGLHDSPDDIRTYLRNEVGANYKTELIDAYLKHGPEMVDFMVNTMGVKFILAGQMPDYHPDKPGASKGGRSLMTESVNARILGNELRRLRPLPRELSLFGMGVSSGSDLGHLYKFGRSLNSTLVVMRLLMKFAWDKMRFGRSMTLVNGNALIARLAKVLIDLGTPIWTFSPASELIVEDGEVKGAFVHRHGECIAVRASKGVILASGGFAQNPERRDKIYNHPARAEEHVSLTSPGNIGDGARLAESVGGFVDDNVTNAGAWMPISKVPRPDGTWGPILHSVNHGKPGMISVLRNGKRFADESLSYHDFVEQMIRHPEAGKPAGAYIICDQKTFKKYGLGYAKPFLSLNKLIETGYLIRARSIADLAEQTKIDPTALAETIDSYNRHARTGEDPEFGKGQSSYGHFLGDLDHKPNPNIGPLEQAPYYAVWMYAGDIGNFAGVKTDKHARVVDITQKPINGLFAVGNDMASVFSGSYPGGGALIGPAMTFGYIAARACELRR